jgi:hypothetical protein
LGDDFALMLTQGHPVTIIVRGGQSQDTDGGVLDVQALLMFNDQPAANDDDSARSGQALNARIIFSPPITGLYILRVTTSGSGPHHGAYALQVYDGAVFRQL